MNRPVRKDGKLYCPQCGEQIIWDDTQDRGDPDEPDYTTIDYWHCVNCGVTIEIWQALEGDKEEYPYWSKKTPPNK